MTGTGFRFVWLLVGATGVVAVAVLSVIPVSAPVDVPQSDRVVHILIYLVLAGWFCAPRARASWTVAAMTVAYGGMLELVQAGLPWRDGDWIDFGANTAGVVIALATARGFWGRIYRELNRRFVPKGGG